MKLTSEMLDELEGLERAATPGSWEYRPRASGTESDPGLVATVNGGDMAIFESTAYWSHVDGCLIAATRNALPTLLTAARAHLAERDRLVDALARANGQPGEPKPSCRCCIMFNVTRQRLLSRLRLDLGLGWYHVEAEVSRLTAEVERYREACGPRVGDVWEHQRAGYLPRTLHVEDVHVVFAGDVHGRTHMDAATWAREWAAGRLRLVTPAGGEG